MAKRTADALNGVDAVVSAASGVQGKLDDEIQITMLGAGQSNLSTADGLHASISDA